MWVVPAILTIVCFLWSIDRTNTVPCDMWEAVTDGTSTAIDKAVAILISIFIWLVYFIIV